MTETDDDTLDARLAQALGPDADDTAPLSRAVMTRLAEATTSRRAPIAEVLAAPLPATGLMLGLLILAGGLGYALSPVDLDEVTALVALFGPGF